MIALVYATIRLNTGGLSTSDVLASDPQLGTVATCPSLPSCPDSASQNAGADAIHYQQMSRSLFLPSFSNSASRSTPVAPRTS